MSVTRVWREELVEACDAVQPVGPLLALGKGPSPILLLRESPAAHLLVQNGTYFDLFGTYQARIPTYLAPI